MSVSHLGRGDTARREDPEVPRPDRMGSCVGPGARVGGGRRNRRGQAGGAHARRGRCEVPGRRPGAAPELGHDPEVRVPARTPPDSLGRVSGLPPAQAVGCRPSSALQELVVRRPVDRGEEPRASEGLPAVLSGRTLDQREPGPRLEAAEGDEPAHDALHAGRDDEDHGRVREIPRQEGAGASVRAHDALLGIADRRHRDAEARSTPREQDPVVPGQDRNTRLRSHSRLRGGSPAETGR